MRITALVQGCDHVCCRYRIAAFRPFFEQAGHELVIETLPRALWPRVKLFRRLAQNDVVILQRKLMQIWQLYLLRQSAPRLVFDFDDAVFLRNSYSTKGMLSGARMFRFGVTVRTADAVVAGNAFLQEKVWARQPDSRAHVVPTCIDLERYPVARHLDTGTGARLVWIGSSSTLPSLDVSRQLWEEIGRQCRGVQLKLICNRFIHFQHLPVVECNWSPGTESAELVSADIGISWLPDDLWSRGKCGLKVLQYMAAGLPVVANPVGVQAELVQPGMTGFLAETPAQWVEAIRTLAQNPALRRRMGAAARQRVEKDFSVAAGAARWLLVLEELKQRGRAA